MISYQNIIFKLFGGEDKKNDTYQDVSGKGFFERYNEIIGRDIDVEILPFVKDLLANIRVPDTMLTTLFPFAERMLGVNVAIGITAANKRTILRSILKLQSIKGTKLAFQTLFGMFGTSVIVTEHFGSEGFDSPIKLDDPERRFDSGCASCSDYELTLSDGTTGHAIADNILASIVNFNTPVNARLKALTYNSHVYTIVKPLQSNDYKYQIIY